MWLKTKLTSKLSVFNVRYALSYRIEGRDNSIVRSETHRCRRNCPAGCKALPVMTSARQRDRATATTVLRRSRGTISTQTTSDERPAMNS